MNSSNEFQYLFSSDFSISDEWIPMNSTRLRPIETVESVKFQEGDKCLARWTDSRKFPGTVQKVLENGMNELELFEYDSGRDSN